MKEILLINPGKKPKKSKRVPQRRRVETKGTMTMAKRRKRRKAATAPKTTRRRIRRNPAPRRRRRASSIARGASGILRALNIPAAAIGAAKQAGGMLAAQFFAKRFADGGGANSPEWTWKNYAFGTLGAFVAGIGGELIKRGSGHEFLKGGLGLMMYKMVTNELAQKSEWVNTYLGAGMAPGAILGTDGNYYRAGDSYLGGDGEIYLLGNDGLWRPVETVAAEYDEYSMSGTLAPPGELGGTLAPPGELGEDPYARTFGEDPYARAFGAVA